MASNFSPNPNTPYTSILAHSEDVFVILMDFRKEWFRKCILDYLGETDAELMNIFLSRNDHDMGRKFDSFLDDKPQSVINLYNQIFVVYKTYYSKMVEEEIQVQEEGNLRQFSHLRNKLWHPTSTTALHLHRLSALALGTCFR